MAQSEVRGRCQSFECKSKRSTQAGTAEGVRMEARRARTPARRGGLFHDSRSEGQALVTRVELLIMSPS